MQFKRLFPNISESKIKEIEGYLHGYYKLCMNYANILSKKYKTPILPHGEEAGNKIAEYVYKCQKQYL